MVGYRFLEHTADVKFLAEGNDLREAFSNAASALFETIHEGVSVEGRIRKEFVVKGEDEKSLLLNFLEEFLFLLDSESFLPSFVESIEFSPGSLRAIVLGDDASLYVFSNSVKAVTYSEMQIQRDGKGVEVVGVLDV